ncbi:hypothetical protein [Gracilimonas mengyeensis]|uniref:Planctomycete cytochrome C n=1 Tax=Gracilimonas mengyeensis TaxID=1302730 RepID=A0A521AIG7_9BACT|nr:hypothetical protein [Gracilimonas mengyeensis]SMO34635.1 hypothetical protein SAMN06265219_101176 [Gracilimonas mengyeensis]
MEVSSRFLLCSMFILLTSCINNVEDISSAEPVEPSEVSYQEDIQPIFNSTCGGSGCHINGSTNGVNLTTYQQVMNSVGAVYGTDIVIPEDPDASPLVDKIEANPTNGSRMPLTGSYLTPSEINQIRSWIEGGALEN